MLWNKKGFQLSLNMIIMVILAFVFLGIAIMLIRNWGEMINKKIPEIIPPNQALWSPSEDNPVFFSPSELEIKRGNHNVLTLEIYNYATSGVKCTIGFKPGDKDVVKFIYSSANREIPVGEVGKWEIIVKAPKTTAPNVYLYTAKINCGEFSKDADLIINVK